MRELKQALMMLREEADFAHREVSEGRLPDPHKLQRAFKLTEHALRVEKVLEP